LGETVARIGAFFSRCGTGEGVAASLTTREQSKWQKANSKSQMIFHLPFAI
jgi:hypothetical protein